MTDREKAALDALAALYAGIEEESDGSSCLACGKCCRFKSFGHRLYAASVEALYLWTHSGPPAHAFGEDACGYQEGARCTAREGRALGCRLFFCREAGGDSPEDYEKALSEIRRISDAAGLEWDYRPLGEHIARLAAETRTD